MGREEEGRNGRVEPTGVRIDRVVFLLRLETRFTSIVVVFREKLLRRVKLCRLLFEDTNIFRIYIDFYACSLFKVSFFPLGKRRRDESTRRESIILSSMICVRRE